MRMFVKRAAPALVLTSMALFGVWSCQPKETRGSNEPSGPATEDVSAEGELHEVEFVDEISETGELVKRRVKKIRAMTGDRVKFTVDGRTMWVLIPRAKIERYSGGADWAKGTSFIAFKIEGAAEAGKGSATISIRSDYDVPGEEDDFAYSIIELENGEWRYDHDQSPPRMIIRPR